MSSALVRSSDSLQYEIEGKTNDVVKKVQKSEHEKTKGQIKVSGMDTWVWRVLVVLAPSLSFSLN